jgi:ureidoacrylate peracid hydrolase
MTTDDRRSFELDARRTALLVIDVQNDFCHPNGYFARFGFDVSPCAEVVPRIARVVTTARRRGLQVVWTMSTNADPPLHRLRPARFRRSAAGERPPDQFVPGSWGWRIVDGLEPDATELVVRKPRYDAFLRTTLEDDFRSRGVTTVVATGVITNCCVDTTARSAFMRGFDVLVLRDCVATFAEEHDLHDASLRNLAQLFAVVADEAALEEALAAVTPAVSGPA